MKLLIVDGTPIVEFANGVKKRIEKLSFEECVDVERECIVRTKNVVHKMQSVLQRNNVALNTVEPERYITDKEDKEFFLKLIDDYNKICEWRKIVVFNADKLKINTVGISKNLEKKLKKGKGKDA